VGLAINLLRESTPFMLSMLLPLLAALLLSRVRENEPNLST
jgi:hypothetical protein